MLLPGGRGTDCGALGGGGVPAHRDPQEKVWPQMLGRTGAGGGGLLLILCDILESCQVLDGIICCPVPTGS